MKQNQTRMSLEPHNCIGDHVPLNDALVASNVNDIAMEWKGTVVDMLWELRDHFNCNITHEEIITSNQDLQTRRDSEHSYDIITAGGDHVSTERNTRHRNIMNHVMYDITTRQVPFTNIPCNKFINESVTRKNQ